MSIYQELLEALEYVDVIDAHEHLIPESWRVAQPVDVFTLFSYNTKVDLLAAGMSEQQYATIQDCSVPLERRWAIFEPFLELIRHQSTPRPAFIAAKEFCEADDISSKTCRDISERLAAQNTPGLYQRILREKCRIRGVLLVGLGRERAETKFTYVTSVNRVFHHLCSREDLERTAAWLGHTVGSLDDLLAMVRDMILTGAAEGNPGVKLFALDYKTPNRQEAESVFARLMNGETYHFPRYCGQVPFPEENALLSWLMEETLKMVAEVNGVAAIHTGVWGDFRALKASHMIPLFQRHPGVRFDVFHCGLPYVRETGFLGKNFPNVWLNLCWSHVCAPRMTRSLLNEWMDFVPANKIIAFGGDYNRQVEKVYGHLRMARENIACVLASRIAEETMDFEEAARLAKQWFFDNPAALYRIKPWE